MQRSSCPSLPGIMSTKAPGASLGGQPLPGYVYSRFRPARTFSAGLLCWRWPPGGPQPRPQASHIHRAPTRVHCQRAASVPAVRAGRRVLESCGCPGKHICGEPAARRPLLIAALGKLQRAAHMQLYVGGSICSRQGSSDRKASSAT